MNNPVPEFAASTRPSAEALALIMTAPKELTLVTEYPVPDSPEAAESVNRDLIRIKASKDFLETNRTKITGPLHQAWQAANSFFKGPIDALTQAENRCKSLLLTYQNNEEAKRQEAERKRIAEERRIREEQERKAAEIRARAEEQARQEREKAEKAERERQEAIARGDNREAQKQAALAAGAQERAEQVVTSAENKVADAVATAPLPAASPAPAPAALTGFSTRTKWKGRVKGLNDAERAANKLELIKAAATDPQAAALLLVDEKALDRLAGALKKNLTIPGIEAYEEQVAASRR